jgi:hypothetical protein
VTTFVQAGYLAIKPEADRAVGPAKFRQSGGFATGGATPEVACKAQQSKQLLEHGPEGPSFVQAYLLHAPLKFWSCYVRSCSAELSTGAASAGVQLRGTSARNRVL